MLEGINIIADVACELGFKYPQHFYQTAEKWVRSTSQQYRSLNKAGGYGFEPGAKINVFTSSVGFCNSTPRITRGFLKNILVAVAKSKYMFFYKGYYHI
ncbi:hypothetical protein AQ505_17335 [Pedobacter sp. PACM 27299]|nr:hypothetical protein AQ505_17335 [Pedobacter sp. PACM 27299]